MDYQIVLEQRKKRESYPQIQMKIYQGEPDRDKGYISAIIRYDLNFNRIVSFVFVPIRFGNSLSPDEAKEIADWLEFGAKAADMLAAKIVDLSDFNRRWEAELNGRTVTMREVGGNEH